MNIENSDALKIIGDLERIRVALAKIGGAYADNQDGLQRALTYFAIDFGLFETVSSCHKILLNYAEKDTKLSGDLDEFFEGIDYWKPPVNLSEADLRERINQKSIQVDSSASENT